MGSYVEFKNVKKVYRMGEVLIEAQVEQSSY